MDNNRAIWKALRWQYRIGFRLRSMPNALDSLCVLNDAFIELGLTCGLHPADFFAIDRQVRDEWPLTADQTRRYISYAMTREQGVQRGSFD